MATYRASSRRSGRGKESRDDADESMENMDDCFNTGARLNKNKNKRNPVVVFNGNAKQSKLAPPEQFVLNTDVVAAARAYNNGGVVDTPTTFASFEKNVQLLGQTLNEDDDAGEEEEEEEEEEEAGCIDDDKVVALVDDAIDNKIGAELHEFLSKKYIKSLRDPINKKVATQLDAFKSDVLPKLENIHRMASSTHANANDTNKMMKEVLEASNKIKHEARQRSKWMCAKLGTVDNRLRAIERRLGIERDTDN